ncbi:hypothetical protein EPUS_08322 [Endocarpon pusillum Z07020]|uniref:tRNA pseudouridine synthase 1 n=1 Tax=Endocarpon pusillum (strain Z07020 / HMAS-L-300199) TaxID=1263415 RepID=U1GSX0_ENDPU|nr:uncharacterized protein EPUS_08322 [Endocarpon pusillum Z07020]ERF75508.1 hypothetical protein EPUS_08322 [Endocarpon pusillum Z07020]
MDQASASQTSESRDSLPGGAGAGTEQFHSKSVSDRSKVRGRGRGGPPNKKRDMGRSEWSKTKPDKRRRNDDQQAAKRQRIDRGDAPLPAYATQFSKDDIAAEERRPKKKVAVLIGYSGTGYRGMQFAHDQKTVEGDLFKAFVAAGAISKANADDPKKSSFVRCARTDKGVHAAGNVISLKLIVEDEDTVQKINEHLSPQIRVWGYERTINSFSAYQLVDSRIYEYLIPTHSFLPPHPSSYLGQKIAESARENDDEERWRSRQDEVEGFWEKVDEEHITQILEGYDADSRNVLERALYPKEGNAAAPAPSQNKESNRIGEELGSIRSHEATEAFLNSGVNENNRREIEEFLDKIDKENASETQVKLMLEDYDNDTRVLLETALLLREQEPSRSAASLACEAQSSLTTKDKNLPTIAEGIKKLRAAYIAAKRSYRISPARLERVRSCLAMYEGTRNFHNFTVEKKFRDPSAKRVIKSFIVNPKPILINGTEWLSLKVHGQSFMMHQIRKMVGMVALVIRCGCDPKRIAEAYGEGSISIPKAPSLGLLLERPVFDSYNKRAKSEHGKEAIDFSKYESEMEEFKQREIYERIYRDEEKNNVFGNFFNHVDNFASEAFLFVTSGGITATKAAGRNSGDKDVSIDPALESEPENETVRNGEGEEG